jgi:hypothetical protein
VVVVVVRFLEDEWLPEVQVQAPAPAAPTSTYQPLTTLPHPCHRDLAQHFRKECFEKFGFPRFSKTLLLTLI